MKIVLPGFCLLLFCFLINGAFADQVYTWTDRDGNMHITAEPPPGNARIKDVIEYVPKTDETSSDVQQHRDSEAPGAPGEKETDEVRQARAVAKKARQEAQTAKAKAEEATKAAEKYIETHNQNEYMRRAHQYQMRKAADDAKAAVEQARIAEVKAIEAEKKVKLAEEKMKLAEENANDLDD